MGKLIDHTDEEGRPYREVDKKAAPEVGVEVRPDAGGSWDVRLTVRRFRFSPAGTAARATVGRGVAHVLVDGRLVGRLRAPEFRLSARLVPRGTHHVTARLYADDGTVWAVAGKPVQSTADITASPPTPRTPSTSPDLPGAPCPTGTSSGGSVVGRAGGVGTASAVGVVGRARVVGVVDRAGAVGTATVVGRAGGTGTAGVGRPTGGTGTATVASAAGRPGTTSTAKAPGLPCPTGTASVASAAAADRAVGEARATGSAVPTAVSDAAAGTASTWRGDTGGSAVTTTTAAGSAADALSGTCTVITTAPRAPGEGCAPDGPGARVAAS
ncbi:hypothetical protein GCM10014715_60500 [Streptomyces spiralis]|uniref:Uncharacterized protein n=1 Tax=Streptomyces spiralis TaxID=66376 RepID=A0A919DZW0_9ACTN|nr:hypothetical protein GCM10014715_60500 [Streptomyces spiralis]